MARNRQDVDVDVDVDEIDDTPVSSVSCWLESTSSMNDDDDAVPNVGFFQLAETPLDRPSRGYGSTRMSRGGVDRSTVGNSSNNSSSSYYNQRNFSNSNASSDSAVGASSGNLGGLYQRMDDRSSNRNYAPAPGQGQRRAFRLDTLHERDIDIHSYRGDNFGREFRTGYQDRSDNAPTAAAGGKRSRFDRLMHIQDTEEETKAEAPRGTSFRDQFMSGEVDISDAPRQPPARSQQRPPSGRAPDTTSDIKQGRFRKPTYNYSNHVTEKARNESDDDSENEDGDKPKDFYVRRSKPLEKNFEVLAPAYRRERTTDYKGRLQTWPGALLLSVLGIAAVAFLVISATNVHQDAGKRSEEFNIRKIEALRPNRTKRNSTINKKDELVSKDGRLGNPNIYPDRVCEQPNYVSTNGKLYAQSSNGTSVQITIKGVNWFGMESEHAIPFGLWSNDNNGTTVYEIAYFLKNNGFNAVRLPLRVDAILKNATPNADMINVLENRAISLDGYIGLLKSLITALQFRNIGVLLSMQTLTASDTSGRWFAKGISEEDYLSAIDMLTFDLCKPKYWNVIGIDVKDKPKGTWGTGAKDDFLVAAEGIGNRMLNNCKNWVAFVQGVSSLHNTTLDGKKAQIHDWEGAGLQGAVKYPLTLELKDKVVYAPHYFNPSLYPQKYFYDDVGNQSESGTLESFTELDDKALLERVQWSMNEMFGAVASKTGPTLILGEFGGVYANDQHPLKTSRRVTDMVLQTIKSSPGWSGGFVWSLNPEMRYEFSSADMLQAVNEGIYAADWFAVNTDYVRALAVLDDLGTVQPFPCFSGKGNVTRVAAPGSASGSSSGSNSMASSKASSTSTASSKST